MVTSINSMAHLLDIKTVAKNVDAEVLVGILKAMGLDFAQGYYLGELMPLDQDGLVLGWIYLKLRSTSLV